MIGDSIVIHKAVSWGSLIIYEVKVYECSSGTYGYLCDKMCDNCLENQCDRITGVCIKGCNDNRYGDMCDKECPAKCGNSCDRYLGCTNCSPGFTGASCTKCMDGTFGKNCGFTCTNCRLEFCDNIEGCQQCLRGFYGPNCNNSCPDHCRNSECNKTSGFCSVGCEDGFMGSNCEIPCRSNCVTCVSIVLCSSCIDGRYGQQCELSCSETCGGKQTCDKESGRCDECMDGKYGKTCTKLCSNNCKSSMCQRDGDCIDGCNEGWLGLNCSMKCTENYCLECILSGSTVSCNKCEEGYYLGNQDKCQICPSNCLSCENKSKCTRCKTKFTGPLCDKDCNRNCIDHVCETDGVCTYGCNNRKHGVECSSECRANCEHCYDYNNCTQCSPGYYGLYCSSCYQNCYNCTSNRECSSCKPGFHGKYCQFPCSPECLTCNASDFCTYCKEGWSGRTCQCNVNCNDECGDNGKCVNGCKSSFYGEYCNVSCPVENCQICDQKFGNCIKCKEGRYGNQCDMDCRRTCVGSVCDIDGKCLQGCQEGLTGENCEMSKQTKDIPDAPLYVFVLIGGALLVALVLILVIVLRRNLQEKQKSLSPPMEKDMRLTEFLNEEDRIYANENEQNDSPQIQRRSLYTEISPYNLRGSQAYLIELDPNDVDDVDVPTSVESDYYNVKITLVPVDKLWENVQLKKSRGELHTEFESIPNGLLEPCKEALKPQNRSRNRYKKMYPYDSTRVILQVEKGTENTDFINACFVHGFEKEREYIAAQGPFTPETVYDFWRMIWQQDCGKIVMLTNVVENEIMKCKKYWPDKEESYGHFHVKLVKEDITADYTTRYFILSANGNTKVITQFHFTAWPDKGVPQNVTSIVDFRNKVVSHDAKQDGPMLIHCSAGVGRTGTFMALDFLIKQGVRERSVDVINCVARMRQQRVHVVQTVEQYVFLHDALVEALTEGKGVVTANEFPEYYKCLKQLNPSTKKSGLWEQFQLINKLSPVFDDRNFQTAKLKENRCKNRYTNVLASDNYRIFISSGDNNYINAIQIPGYKRRNSFALTQMPLTNTVQDFWFLVLEQDVSTIVMMNSFKNDKSMGIYWPVDKDEVTFGPITVKLLEREAGNAPYGVLKMKVLNVKTQEERIVKQFQCKFWSEDAVRPERPEPMLEMIEEINAWQKQVNNPVIVVHCMNGAKKSGLFCTVATVFERLRTEQEVGVLQTVIQMRTRRSQIVPSLEQLVFCYDAVQTYTDMSNTYMNI
ncbi:receptor-type tyrosine-protein phosphatase kappa-like [Saccostrea echinata]|uniref:receptor-type tyrosine-protein phosphatase kappa-like n=1 Tax=Saccostrea echinata TaxID=191078 RepID=UPI002A81896D|nr:receptor-type tyrosine-protein phosphatase kappa-like [Saccostrea echinata]